MRRRPRKINFGNSRAAGGGRSGRAVLAALALGAGLCLCRSEAPLAAAQAQARLDIQPRFLDFGERGHEETPHGELVITNRGDAALVLTRLEPSCSCIQISPAKLEPIPPGASRAITVSMSSGRAIGKLVKELRIESNDARAPRVSVPVGMKVLEGFEVEPRELRLTGIIGGAPAEASLDVLYRPAGKAKKDDGGAKAPFELKDIDFRAPSYSASKPAHFKGSAEPIPGGVRVKVTLSPSHPEGRIQSDLRARINGKDLVVPITGEMFAWILVDNTYLNFSQARVDEAESRLRELRLSSTDGQAFQVLRVEEDSSTRRAPDAAPVELKFTVNSSPNRQAHAIRVEVVPKDPEKSIGRSFFGKLIVHTDHPKKARLTVSYGGFFQRPPAAKK
jgi:hypothetical protein